MTQKAEARKTGTCPSFFWLLRANDTYTEYVTLCYSVAAHHGYAFAIIEWRFCEIDSARIQDCFVPSDILQEGLL